MSVTPPAGFGVYTRTGQPTTGGKPAVNTFGFRNTLGSAAATCMAALNSSLSTTGRPYNSAQFNSDWTQTEQYCLVNIGGVLTSAAQSFSTAGTLTTKSPSAGTSVVVRKFTGLAGRQYRGRVAYFPCSVDEALVDAAGIIDASLITNITATFAAAVAAANTANVPFYLLHGPNKLGVTPVPTVVTSMVPDSLVGSQRRRLRR